MPAEPGDPTDPREWLRRARSNLNLARVGRQADVLLADLCFEAQQAAEKAIKAVLVATSTRFPKTHVLSDLLDLAFERGVPVPDSVREAQILSAYAVAGRYPGWAEDVSLEQYERAVELADRVLMWAAGSVRA